MLHIKNQDPDLQIGYKFNQFDRSKLYMKTGFWVKFWIFDHKISKSLAKGVEVAANTGPRDVLKTQPVHLPPRLMLNCKIMVEKPK